MRALLKFVAEVRMMDSPSLAVRPLINRCPCHPTPTGRFAMTTKLPAAVDPSVDPLIENGVFIPKRTVYPCPMESFNIRFSTRS